MLIKFILKLFQFQFQMWLLEIVQSIFVDLVNLLEMLWKMVIKYDPKDVEVSKILSSTPFPLSLILHKHYDLGLCD